MKWVVGPCSDLIVPKQLRRLSDVTAKCASQMEWVDDGIISDTAVSTKLLSDLPSVRPHVPIPATWVEGENPRPTS